MKAEIIAIGEEVLAGDTINTNAAVISAKLADIGVFCRYHTVLGDVEEDIVQQLKISTKRSDVIILCGGLGPTEDDLTKESVATFVEKPLVKSDYMMNHVEEWFKSFGKVPTKNNYKQGLMIEGGVVLHNINGTACGVFYEYDDVLLYLLPGPPREMLPMLEQEVIPLLSQRVEKVILTKIYRLVGIGESNAVTILEDIMQASHELIVAPYAKLREVHIKVTSIQLTKELAEEAVAQIGKIIEERLGEYIFTCHHENLEDVLVKQLKARGQTISFAESCTAGILSSLFVNASGASAVFNQSVITYSNESKTELIGVEETLLESFGAVSEEVAKAMADGLYNTFKSDFGIGVTGIAGPTGGTDEKPVGLVYIGMRTPTGTQVFKHQFKGDREKVRQQAAKTALIHLWQYLKTK